MLKEIKMVSCGVAGCTSRTGKNSNVITLFTRIIMLLQLYHGITLIYLILVAYSKPCQIY